MNSERSHHRLSRRSVLGKTLGLTAAFAGLGACGPPLAPVNDCLSLTPTPETDTVPVHFLYSTEKEAWLSAAIDDFHNTNHQCNGKPIEIIPSSSGSADMVDQILTRRGDAKLIACSPASALELNRLDYLSRQSRYFGQSIISYNGDLSPQDLVSSPLVFAIWKQFADLLRAKYRRIDWDTLYHALTLPEGWQDLGRPDLGKQIHLGQTLPSESNSGLLALTLMANAYLTSVNQPLTATAVAGRNTGLWDYVDVFEQLVNGFGKSSGTYWNEVIALGPAQYAIIFTYENLVLQKPDPQMEMFYPAENLVSNHPFAILNNPLLVGYPDRMQEQQRAAKAFRDFLRTEEQQRAAIHAGFRPWNARHPLVDLESDDSPNPFDQLKPTSRPSQISPAHALDTVIDVINEPFGSTVDALITEWEIRYPNPSSS